RAQIDLLLEAASDMRRQVQSAAADQDKTALAARLAEASRVVPEPAVRAPEPVEKVAPAPVDPALPRLDIFFSVSQSCQAPGARRPSISCSIRPPRCCTASPACARLPASCPRMWPARSSRRSTACAAPRATCTAG